MRLLRAAFPAGLQTDVDAVLNVLPRSLSYERLVGPPIRIEGEPIRLIGRLFCPELPDRQMRGLTERQQLIASCLYTRHHDGHVRQRHLAGVRGDEPWLPHFVLQLISEYVIEIAEAALEQIDAIPVARYQAFAEENDEFMALVRSRVVSYYDAYMRPSRFDSTPAYRFLTSLSLWEGPEARRSIARDRRFSRR